MGWEGRAREDIPEDGEANVDEEVGAAAGDHEDAYWWDCGRWCVSTLPILASELEYSSYCSCLFVIERDNAKGRQEGALRKIVMMMIRTAEMGLVRAIVVFVRVLIGEYDVG